MINNPDLGQVFTAPVIADYMVSLFSINKEASVLDPCYGGGAFLKALKKSSYVNVTGYEIDKKWHDLAINNYKEYSIKYGNFLEVDSTPKYDGIIMNPPYIRHEKIDDLADSGITKKELYKNPIFRELPRTANMYMFFILKGIDLLSEKGEMIAIFPNSWMIARGGKGFKKLIEERASITDQIDVYGEVFEGKALVEVSILKIVKKVSQHETKNQRIKVENNTILVDKPEDLIIAMDLPQPFHEYGTVRRGLTTGCNTIFINPPLKTSNCLKNIISSPKDFEGYNTDTAHFDKLLYVKNKDETSEEVNSYLHSCEEKILSTGEPKTLYEKVIKGQCWYKLNLFPCDGIIFNYFVRNEIRFSLNSSDAVIRDNFYIIHPNQSVGNYLMMALLNNYYTYLQLEKIGKKYGAGLLKIQRYDIESLKFVDISKLSKYQIKDLKNLGELLVKTSNVRIIEDITSIISESLGIDFKQIKQSYEAVKKHRLERV